MRSTVIFSGLNLRILKQRWPAREKTYRFRAEPRIPGMKMHGNGHKVRAGTLDEAKEQLYLYVVKRVWEISLNFVSMIVYWEDGHRKISHSIVEIHRPKSNLKNRVDPVIEN